MNSFYEIHQRQNTRSLKWDMLEAVFQSSDVLPMWVADMDFKAPDMVNQAIIDRAKHGIWGYTIVDQHVKKAIVNWIHHRHTRSEEHTSELQSRGHLVCRLLLEKKNIIST